MKLLALLLRTSKWGLAVAIFFGLLAGASFTSLISLINRVVGGQAEATPQLAALFAGIGVLALVTRIISQMLVNRIHYGVIFDLRMRLCRRLLAAPLRRLEESGSHRMMASLTEDVLAISQAFVSLPSIIINLAIVTGCLVYVGWLSWKVMLCLLAFMVVGIASYRGPTMRAVRFMAQTRQTQDVLFKHFRGLIEGTKELKLHDRRREAFLVEELERTSSELRVLQIRGNDIFAFVWNWGVLLFFIFIGLLLFVLPHFIPMERGVLMGYAIVVLYLQQPVQFVTDCMPLLGRGSIALSKIEELAGSMDQVDERGGALVAGDEPRSFSRVELVGITHSYLREKENSVFTLGPIDLTLSPGELLFLVGGNGSGKTTLAKLIAGLYVPESGELRLDGVPVRAEELGRYRQLFSAVFSDFYLFERLLGLPSDTVGQQARGYLEKLQLAHKVRLEGSTLSTTSLSQGQRKRLALLTAYLEDRPIYLFDEWAADQDPVFREIFYREFLPELKRRGKTVVVISHDDKYFSVGDRVLRLEFGKLLRPANVPLREVGT